MHRQTLALSEKVLIQEHPDILMSMNNLALVLESQGKYEKAKMMYRQTLAQREKMLGKEHVDTLTSVYCLAHLLAGQPRSVDEAAVLYQRAYDGYCVVLGDSQPTTRVCQWHYSEMLQRKKNSQSVSATEAS